MTSNSRALLSPPAPPKVSTGRPILTWTNPLSSNRRRQPAHGRPPAIQSLHRSMLRTAACGTTLPVAMSANCNRPPGRNTRITSLKTRRLSAQRLMTPLLMTTSAQPFSTGDSSELDVGEAHRGRRCTGAFQHLVGHVDADDAPLGADLCGGDEAVETAARPEIDHPLP